MGVGLFSIIFLLLRILGVMLIALIFDLILFFIFSLLKVEKAEIAVTWVGFGIQISMIVLFVIITVLLVECTFTELA